MEKEGLGCTALILNIIHDIFCNTMIIVVKIKNKNILYNFHTAGSLGGTFSH